VPTCTTSPVGLTSSAPDDAGVQRPGTGGSGGAGEPTAGPGQRPGAAHRHEGAERARRPRRPTRRRRRSAPPPCPRSRSPPPPTGTR
jgi:hypothetical protein